MKRKIFAVLILLCAYIVNLNSVFAAVNMIAISSQNEGIFAVPAPGPVEIDGDLSEWDLSGRIMVFNDFSLVDTFGAEISAMYDEDNYYLGITVKDPTPMVNLMDPVKESGWRWKGDCLQLRFITDQTSWVTMAYYSKEDRSSIDFAYWLNQSDHNLGLESIIYYSEPDSADLNLTYSSKPARKYEGIQQKFKKFENGGGYYQEVKIPWEYLYKGGKSMVAAGNKFKMGVEVYWGDATGSNIHEYKCFDNFMPGKTGSDFFWEAKDVWGYVTLMSSGNLPLRQYIPDKKETGSIKIRLEVPKEAKFMTLVAENQKGERVSNIAAEINLDECTLEEKEKTKVVEYMWNGKDDLGKMVPPGVYNITGITHEGLDPIFDTVFYNPGTPPWPTANRTGEWGADHAPPVSTASYGEMVYVGWEMAEGGHALIALGPDGKKAWGENRGAMVMAANEKYVFSVPEGGFYVSAGSTTGNNYIMRLGRESGDYLPFVYEGKERKFEYMLNDAFGIGGSIVPTVRGMAADNNNLLITTGRDNGRGAVVGGLNFNFLSCINVIDCETGVLKNRVSVSDVGDVTISKDGRVYVVSGSKVFEVNIVSGYMSELKLNGGKGFLPGAITTDLDGNIVVFDKGDDSQIKVFGSAGELIYTAGKKGGRPLTGYFDEQAMIKVSDVTVDFRGDIWAVENWNYPRRVSVWGRDGLLVKDYVGNTGYAASGAFLHEQDTNRAYIGPVELILDRETDSYKVSRIVWLPDEEAGESFSINHGSHTSIKYFSSDASGQKKEYIFDSADDEFAADVLLMEQPDGTYKPVHAMGAIGFLFSRGTKNAEDGNDPIYKRFCDNFPGINTLSKYQLFMWNDFNKDGKVQFEECEFFIDPNTRDFSENVRSFSFANYSYWGCTMTSDMRYAKASFMGQGVVFEPEYFMDDGAPVYTKKSMKWVDSERRLAMSDNVLVEGSNQILSVATNGNQDKHRTTIKLVDFDKNGKDLWTYNNKYPGVHGSHGATIQEPGLVLGSIKTMGVVPISDGQRVFAIRGNLGCDYFMTMDGFFVQTMFRDGRLPRNTLPSTLEEAKGSSMQKLTEGAEPFGGWFGMQDDGKYRMIVSMGGRSAIVAEIKGLDTIKKFKPFKLRLTTDMINEAEAFNAMLEKESTAGVSDNSEAVDATEYQIHRAEDPVTIDGDLSDWGNAANLPISKAGIPEKGNAKLAWDDEYLYAAFTVNDESPMLNTGRDFTRMFKTGDAVDILLSTSGNKTEKAVSGDIRIVMSMMNQNPVAVLMKPVDKTAGADLSFVYSSPVMSVNFDRVEILKNADVNIKIEGMTYVVEAKIPLADIGLKPNEGMFITGDLGIITSDSMGTVNIARIYHYTKNTELTSDLPQEASLYPNKWGIMKFVK